MAKRFSSFMAVLCAASTLLYLFLSSPTHHFLTLEVNAAQDGPVQVFYDTGAGFNERESQTKFATQGQNILFFYMPTGVIYRMRVDPSPRQGPFQIERAGVGSKREVTTFIDLLNFSRVKQADAVQADSGIILRFKQAATDPHITIEFKEPLRIQGGYREFFPSILLLIISASIGLLLLPMLGRAQRLSLFFGIPVATLIFTMALVTPATNPHPDEPLHRADASYFLHHSLPPRLDSNSLGTSLAASPWGVSYLFEWNVVYLLAGKTAQLLSSFDLADAYVFRLMNAFFFCSILLIWAWSRADQAYLFPLLVVPQAWYVFAYFNGDAFPLALTFIAVVLGTSWDGRVEDFLRGKVSLNAESVIFAAAMGLLLISKKNYYIVIVFIMLWQAIRLCGMSRISLCASIGLVAFATLFAAGGRHLFDAIPKGVAILSALIGLFCGALVLRYVIQLLAGRAVNTAIVRRTVAVYAIALMVALPWIIADVVINGMGDEKAATVGRLIESHAHDAFKPSTVSARPDESHPGIRLADKGVALTELAHSFNWFQTSFRSFYAAFGYMRFYAPDNVYWVFALLFLAILVCGIYSLAKSDTEWDMYVVLTITCCILLVFVSYLHSWTYALQPQGRYLFGILPMCGPLAAMAGQQPRLRAISNTLCLFGVLMAATTFINIGLLNTIRH